MKHAYIERNFNKKTLEIVEQANVIIEEYQEQNLKLSIRQLYYQFVRRDLFENTSKRYKSFVDFMTNTRLGGLVDWDAIEDRTRKLVTHYSNDDPGDAVQSALDCFNLDMWTDQSDYVEVWIEKDALTGVIADICYEWNVPYFACKGYNSISNMYESARRFRWCENIGKRVTIIHLGDHDPSGIDMTRDIFDRLDILNFQPNVKRIALNMNQIEELNPPPNPIKFKDTRSGDYERLYGSSSWELDALEPQYMQDLIETEIKNHIDFIVWKRRLALQEEYKGVLQNVVNNWESL